MKRILLTVALLATQVSFAAVKLSGTIGMNTLSHIKVQKEGSETNLGFDVVRFSIKGKKGDFTGLLKANFDLTKDDLIDGEDDSQSKSMYLLDEMSIMHNYEDMIYTTIGKTSLPFNTLHWGALKPYLVDGDSFYTHDTYRSTHFRNDESVMALKVKYSNEDLGLENEFAIFGRPASQTGSSNETESSEKVIDFREQRGASNKITYTYDETHKVALGAKWYKNDYWREHSVAGSISYDYLGETVNFWAGYMYGTWNPHDETTELRDDTYHAAESKEHVAQIGAEYELTDFVNLNINLEYYLTKDNEFKYDGTNWQNTLEDLKTEKTSYRVEAGTKLKFTKTAFMNIGATYEKNEVKFIGDSATSMANKLRYAGYKGGETKESEVMAFVSSFTYLF